MGLVAKKYKQTRVYSKDDKLTYDTESYICVQVVTDFMKDVAWMSTCNYELSSLLYIYSLACSLLSTSYPYTTIYSIDFYTCSLSRKCPEKGC